MKTLIFGGYSDDTFGEITPRGDDFDNCASGEPIEWLIQSPSEGLGILIVGQYAPTDRGGWLIGASPWDPEHIDQPPPNWPIRMMRRPDCPYSLALEIDVPDDATLRCLQCLDEQG